MKLRLLISLAALVLIVAACGGDSDDSDSSDGGDDSSGSGETETAATEEATEEASEEAGDSDSSEDAAAPPPSGGGGATLSLANGETIEFSPLCYLESQDVAGSVILFNAVSYDDPGLDVTQFGDEGVVTGTSVVSVYNASFETLWEASSSYEALGGGLTLTLDGSTITGKGVFFPQGDPAQAPVDGDLVVNC